MCCFSVLICGKIQNFCLCVLSLNQQLTQPPDLILGFCQTTQKQIRTNSFVKRYNIVGKKRADCAAAEALFDMPNLNRFDIFQNHHIDIDIFQNHLINIDIDIFGIALTISISIFSTSPYRYRYFSKVSIYQQSIIHIYILTRRRSKKMFFTGVHGEGVIKWVLQGQKSAFFYHFLDKFHGMSFSTVHYNIHKCRKRYC